MTQQRRILSFTFSAAALPLLPSSEPVCLVFAIYRVARASRRSAMTMTKPFRRRASSSTGPVPWEKMAWRHEYLSNGRCGQTCLLVRLGDSF